MGALIGLNMWIEGAAYSADSIEAMMRAAELEDIRVSTLHDTPAPAVLGDLVIGQRPT